MSALAVTPWGYLGGFGGGFLRYHAGVRARWMPCKAGWQKVAARAESVGVQVVENLQDTRIRRLPRLLANQIAAGEVIERPSSVVKELLENSLDAGADRVSVELGNAGLRLVRVRDNGRGILPDDLPLALARHATSKVRTLADLERVTSMGFRGEALSSIAAVSRLTIDSMHATQTHGWRLSAEGEGRIGVPEPLAHPTGTTVEVRDLFFNTPARLKFLRSERTELQHIEHVFKRIALANTEVALSLRHNDKSVLSLPLGGRAGGMVERLGKVCGAQFVQSSVEFEFETAGIRVFGWLATPEFTRSQTDRQYFFINGRCVRDGTVSHAIRQAYGDDLPPGRHAAYVVHLELDPREVDVNVHPAKLEVRFRNTRLVHDFVASRLRSALRELGADPQGIPPGAAQPGGYPADSAANLHPHAREAWSAGYTAVPGLFGPLEGESQRHGQGRFGRPVGICGKRYLLTLAHERFWIVDVVAAREKIALAALGGMLARGKPLQRPVLVPPAVNIDKALLDAAEGELPALQALGLELRRIAPETVSVRQLPAFFDRVDMEQLATQVLSCWSMLGSDTGAETRLVNIHEMVVEVLARCHARQSDWEAPQLDSLLGELDSIAVDADESNQVCVPLDEDVIKGLLRARG